MDSDQIREKMMKYFEKNRLKIGSLQTYVLLDKEGNILRSELDAPCISALLYRKEYIPDTKYIACYVRSRSRLLSKKEIRFYSWLVNKSLFARVFLSMNHSQIEDRVLLIDVEGQPHDLIGKALKATRFPYEHGRELEDIEALSKKGLKYDLSVFFMKKSDNTLVQRCLGHSFLTGLTYSGAWACALHELRFSEVSFNDKGYVEGTGDWIVDRDAPEIYENLEKKEVEIGVNPFSSEKTKVLIYDFDKVIEAFNHR